MVKLYWWKKLKVAHQNADGIRDHKVQAERHKSAIELAELETERRFLDQRETQLDEEIRSIGKTEAWARFKRREGRTWLAFFVAAIALTVGAVLWALQPMELGLGKQLLIASFTIVISVGGFEVFLRQLGRLLPESGFRKKLLVMGLTAMLCGLFGSTLFAVSRGLVIGVQAKQSQAQTAEMDNDRSLTIQAEQLEKTKRVSLLLDIALVLALVSLAIGGEIVGGLSLFNMRLGFADATPILALYMEAGKVQRAIIKNEHDQESARRGPDILFEELTAGALYVDAKEEKQPMLQNENERVIEVKSNASNESPAKDEEGGSVGAVICKTVIVFVTGMLVLGALVGWALAADTVVIGIDLTTSTHADREFEENLSKVEEIIKSQKAPGTRIAVLGITADSFGAPIIFDDVVPREPGRFGQQINAWRLRAINRWRARSALLKPIEKGSDIFGFFMRASVIFADDPNGEKRLLVLSDMRHVGSGYNFEFAGGLSKARFDELDARGLLPNLQAVKVWILAAHTTGLLPVHWAKLKEFWSDYLKRAGAALVTFSPSRRFAENTR